MVCEHKQNERYGTSGRAGQQADAGGRRGTGDGDGGLTESGVRADAGAQGRRAADAAGAVTVRRIVANIATGDLERAKAFYRGLFGLELVMDLGWIVTFAAEAPARPQVSVGVEGGSGTALPDISIEVDDVDAVHRRAVEAGYEIVYGIADEPWGVRRFHLRDPSGKVLNVLAHAR